VDNGAGDTGAGATTAFAAGTMVSSTTLTVSTALTGMGSATEDLLCFPVFTRVVLDCVARAGAALVTVAGVVDCFFGINFLNSHYMRSPVHFHEETFYSFDTSLEPEERYSEYGLPGFTTFIADPNTALVLLFLGTLGIYAEFCGPGRIAPGVIGSVLALFGLSGLALFPLNARGVSLMFAGIVCVALEAILHARGMLLLCGSIALTAGAVLLIDPHSPAMKIRLSVAIATAVPFAAITAFLFSIALRARRNKSIS